MRNPTPSAKVEVVRAGGQFPMLTGFVPKLQFKEHGELLFRIDRVMLRDHIGNGLALRW